MVVMAGVLSLCRVTEALFGQLPVIPEGLQVFSVSQVQVFVSFMHEWYSFCFLFFGWVLLCRLFLAIFGDV